MKHRRFRGLGRVVFCVLGFGFLIGCLLVGPALAGADRVEVIKSLGKMILVQEDRVIHEFSIAMGKVPQGHKSRQGDERTPEGRYILDYKKEDSAFYRAMHISYPNAGDRAGAKKKGLDPGGAIMVHGQKNGFGWLGWIIQMFDWTDGCIALTNSDMDVFMENVNAGTPIIIVWEPADSR